MFKEEAPAVGRRAQVAEASAKRGWIREPSRGFRETGMDQGTIPLEHQETCHHAFGIYRSASPATGTRSRALFGPGIVC